MTDKRIALSTAGSAEEAQRIATALVERRLAACVNVVGPVQSTYTWQGKVERAGEFLLIIKTTENRVTALEAAVRELHSYEVPEFVVVNIESGSAAYLAWIAESVGGNEK